MRLMLLPFIFVGLSSHASGSIPSVECSSKPISQMDFVKKIFTPGQSEVDAVAARTVQARDCTKITGCSEWKAFYTDPKGYFSFRAGVTFLLAPASLSVIIRAHQGSVN